MIAAVLCSLGFTFFFTAPEYALRVARVQDAVAAVVFLVVGSVVGLLVARMIDERERATERERDARLLGYLATKLLSGEPLDRVLDDFASALIEPFGLLRCMVSATTEDGVARGAVDRWRRAGRSDADAHHLDRERLVRHVDRRSAGGRQGLQRRRPRAAGGGREASGVRARAGAVGRAGPWRTAGLRDQPAASCAVLERDPRPADAARVDQGRGLEPALR